MNDIHGIRLAALSTQFEKGTDRTWKKRSANTGSTPVWRPPLNVYQRDDCLILCADLAGVDRAAIDLRVERRRLVIRGRREAPEPADHPQQPVQVLAMEIDQGAFRGEVKFTVDVEIERVTAEQDNGLLWVYLPLSAGT